MSKILFDFVTKKGEHGKACDHSDIPIWRDTCPPPQWSEWSGFKFCSKVKINNFHN